MESNKDIFKVETTESDEDDIFQKDTVETPHQMSLTYPTYLESNVVDAFSIAPKTKRITEKFVIQRSEDADIILTDSQYPRGFIQIQLMNGNGDVVCTIQNASDRRGKAIKLKYPNQSSMSIQFREEAILLHNSVTVSSLNLVFHLEVIPGDMNASKYNVTATALSSEVFNQRFLASSSMPLAFSQESENEALYRDRDQTFPKRPYTTNICHRNDLSGSQHLSQQQHPYTNNLPTWNTSLSSTSNAFCNLCNTGCNQSIPSLPQFQHLYCQYHLPVSQLYQPEVTAIDQMPVPMQGTARMHQHQMTNPHSLTITQPNIPMQFGSCECRQQMQPQYRIGGGQPHVNWHASHPTDGLPSGPVIGMIPGPHNTVNTHPIQQQSNHDFNPNLIGEYTKKQND